MCTSVIGAERFFGIFRARLLNWQADFQAELSRRLEKQKKELEEKHQAEMALLKKELELSEERGRTLPGIVAHDGNNFLTSIIGFSDLAIMNIKGGNPEKALENMEKASLGAEKLVTLFKKVLIFSSAETKKVSICREPILLNLLVNGNLDVMKVQAEKKGICLDFRIEKDIKVDVDPSRLDQVFMNILGNAIKFTPKRGVIIVTATKNGNRMVKVTVSDTGIGLAKKELGKIFIPFFRAQKEDNNGSGLGLHSCMEIIEAHGGRIWAESPGLGQGSTFHFTLPLAVES